jgi:ketosteroid isomerase-like protein
MLTSLLIALLIGIPANGGAPSATPREVRSSTPDVEADREAILRHIRSIFDAYIRQDRETIRKTHADDWVGFLGPSTGIERGIAKYMENAERSLQGARGMGYEILDTEIQIYGDLAVAYYLARYDLRTPAGELVSMGLRSVDIYRREQGHWNQAGSHITPVPRGGAWGEGAPPASAGGGAPRLLTAAEREELFQARDGVWRAWFAGDREGMERLLPAELVAIDAQVEPWADRAETVRRSQQFASGAKLVRLDFPETRVQVYGDVAILYTRYEVEVEANGTRSTMAGRGTEVFVRRGPQWVNTGWHLDSGR